MPDVDLSVDFAGIPMRTPLTTASGTFGDGTEYADVIDLAPFGAITSKGVAPLAWPGNPAPRIAETASGMLNSIGLQNPGVEAFIDTLPVYAQRVGLPLIVNVVGHSPEEYAAVVETLEAQEVVSAYELNISCPNLAEGEGGMAFGTSCPSAASVVGACRAVATKPLIVKLSPNVTDIVEIARAVEDAGADAISLINTLLGMSIDVRTRRSELGRLYAGLSGPAIKPVALRMVHQVASAVEVPVLGMGGIRSADDAIQFLMAGASAIAIGTATFSDPGAAGRIIDGIVMFCEREGVDRVSELTGTVIV